MNEKTLHLLSKPRGQWRLQQRCWLAHKKNTVIGRSIGKLIQNFKGGNVSDRKHRIDGSKSEDEETYAPRGW